MSDTRDHRNDPLSDVLADALDKTDLLTRLEQAEAGSRELDWAIECHLRGWPLDHMRHAAVLDFTTSLDAALTLVPETLWLSIEWAGGSRDWPVVETPIGKSQAPTPALALCIAALRARA